MAKIWKLVFINLQGNVSELIDARAPPLTGAGAPLGGRAPQVENPWSSVPWERCCPLWRWGPVADGRDTDTAQVQNPSWSTLADISAIKLTWYQHTRAVSQDNADYIMTEPVLQHMYHARCIIWIVNTS